MNLFAPHLTDFYKTGHGAMMPNKTTLVYSNFTCRGMRGASVAPDWDGKTVFFGLQGICQWLFTDLWNDSFFHRKRSYVVDRYKRRMDLGLGEGAVPVEHIEALHGLGYLPILIKALPEGSRVPLRVPPLTIRNTHPDFAWVTNYLETQLSAELWKSITNATTAYEFRRVFDKFARLTGCSPGFVPWQGHDFSMRGMSGVHDASQSGAAHLLSFLGTDTISALDYIDEYYLGRDSAALGGSVPATEHSVMCMGGEIGEMETFRRLMAAYPGGVLSVVSDTWDFWQVMTEFTKQLRFEITARDGKLVFRPASGDPVKILCGDPESPAGSPQHKGAVECLWDVFGGTITNTGHRLLDEHVGLIYGDSINIERQQSILGRLAAKGFASGNIVLGIGSYTYNFVTRDTFGTAIKATFGTVAGRDRVLCKAPKTDTGLKNSAAGLLRVEEANGTFVLHERQTWGEEAQGALRHVFKDGALVWRDSFETIRQRLHGAPT